MKGSKSVKNQLSYPATLDEVIKAVEKQAGLRRNLKADYLMELAIGNLTVDISHHHGTFGIDIGSGDPLSVGNIGELRKMIEHLASQDDPVAAAEKMASAADDASEVMATLVRDPEFQAMVAKYKAKPRSAASAKA